MLWWLAYRLSIVKTTSLWIVRTSADTSKKFYRTSPKLLQNFCNFCRTSKQGLNASGPSKKCSCRPLLFLTERPEGRLHQTGLIKPAPYRVHIGSRVGPSESKFDVHRLSGQWSISLKRRTSLSFQTVPSVYCLVERRSFHEEACAKEQSGATRMATGQYGIRVSTRTHVGSAGPRPNASLVLGEVPRGGVLRISTAALSVLHPYPFCRIFRTLGSKQNFETADRKEFLRLHRQIMDLAAASLWRTS